MVDSEEMDRNAFSLKPASSDVRLRRMVEPVDRDESIFA